MASDPRFDVYPNEVGEVPRRRSKWVTCLIGCLAVLGVMMLILIIGGIWVARNLRGWAADFGSQAVNQGIDSSDLPPQEKGEVKVQVERVATAIRDGRISMEQAGTIMQKVMESPLMPSLVVAAVDKHYFERSGLSADEKAEGLFSLTPLFIDGVVIQPYASDLLVNLLLRLAGVVLGSKLWPRDVDQVL